LHYIYKTKKKKKNKRELFELDFSDYIYIYKTKENCSIYDSSDFFFKNKIFTFSARNLLCVEYTIVESHETFSYIWGRATSPPLDKKARQESGRFKKRARRIFVEKHYKYNRLFVNFHRSKEIRIIFSVTIRTDSTTVYLCTFLFSPHQFRRTIMLRVINFLIAIYGNVLIFLEFVTHCLSILRTMTISRHVNTKSSLER